MRSEWTTWRPPYPSCTRTLSSPTTLAQTGPCPTGSQNARLGKGAPSPQSGPPTHGWCSRNGTPRRGRCPARGPRVNPRDASNPTTRTGHLPTYLAPSLMPQLHDTWEQEAGGKNTEECVGDPRGPVPTHGRPGAETTSPRISQYDSDSTPKAYRLGLETTTRPVNRFRSMPGARPTAWNNDSEGCRTHEARTSPHGCCSSGTPRRGRYPPGFDTDPTITAQWVSLH